MPKAAENLTTPPPGRHVAHATPAAPTRRGLLMGSSAALVLGATAATVAMDADAELLRLCADTEAQRGEMNRITDIACDLPQAALDESGLQDALDDATNAYFDHVERLTATSAHSAAGIKAKGVALSRVLEESIGLAGGELMGDPHDKLAWSFVQDVLAEGRA